jgi:hypothetical protein
MSDLYDAVTQGEGYIVIVDKPTSREIAHPPYCPGVQSEHFHEKVVVNKGKSGGYYLVSTMSEAREAFNAVPCSCARCRRGHGVNSDGGISEANTAALKAGACRLPGRDPPDARGVQGRPGRHADPGAERALRPPRAVRDREPLRPRQHARTTVFERTRELGMLCAVGMTRQQVRRMIRHESIVTALIGAALGIVAGFFLAALVTQALSNEGFAFAVPVGSLVTFVVAAIGVGVVAAILPARRASRLNILQALQYE